MISRTPTVDTSYEAGPFLRRRGNMRVRRDRRMRTLTRLAGIYTWLAVVGLALVWGGQKVWAWALTTPRLAVTDVRVAGQVRAEEQALLGLAAGARGKNLFALDLDALAARVGNHPWVDDVLIRRSLPGTLHIRVTEREPCALLLLDGEAFLLDTSGLRIDRFGPRYPGWSLPVFRGMDSLEPAERLRRSRLAAAQLGVLRRDHPDFFERLAEVDLGDPGFTVLSLEGGAERLRAAPEDWSRNLNEYRALRTELLRAHGSLRHVDLRWRGRIVATPDSDAS